jgi:thymidylate synthase (FAD)
MVDEFYLPPPEDIRLQSQQNKQGRSAETVPPELQAKVLESLLRDQRAVYASYEEMLQSDIARELARINLPLSLYTQWYWQIDLHNLLHFLRLRLDCHAQQEIRAYAEVMAKITKAVAPIAYEAFEEYILYGVSFSRTEMQALRALLQGEENPLTGRARREFEEKLHWNVLASPPNQEGSGRMKRNG